MVSIFYIVTAFFLASLPYFNSYAFISCILFILVFLSPIKILLVQWIVILFWVIWCGRTAGPPLLLDEYYLYLLNALIFILGVPAYISHRRKPQEPWARFLLVPTRYILLVLAVLLLLSPLFRSFPFSNIIWAFLCFIYAYFLPKARKPIRLSTAIGYPLLFSLITIATLLLVEIGVRLFFVAPPKPGRFFMTHPECIFTLLPNSSTLDSVLGNEGKIKEYLVKISSQGIRDREYGPKSSDEFRILMLGDSFTLGTGLEQDETISTTLEQSFAQDATNKQIQVINCGVVGYAPWQEHIFLRERGFQREPDMVILQLFPINDIAGSYSKVGKYLDSIDPLWENDLRNFRRQQELPFFIERLCQQLSQAYRLYLAVAKSPGIIRPLISNLRIVPQKSYPQIFQRSNRHFTVETCLVDYYPGLQEARKIYSDGIKAIRDDCQQRNIPLLAYVHSGIIAAQPEEWKKLNELFPDTPYEMNKDIRITNELLKELGIPCIDVHSCLLAHNQYDMFFVNDGHFTPQGTQVVAECIKGFLLENGYIK